MNKPDLIYHADWSITPGKRWCAKAKLGSDGKYTAYAPEQVDDAITLIKGLRDKAGTDGCVFAGFDFPIGVPAHYADRAAVASFRDFLSIIGKGDGDWSQFFSVANAPAEISVHRPFYPYGSEKGSLQEHLFRAHGVADMEPLLRKCERANGGGQACCLFWTLGRNQVGKAALDGWKHVLIPALEAASVRLWPFDGALNSLLAPGNVVIVETYPAECYGWFSGNPPRSKQNLECRREFGMSLLKWATENEVAMKQGLVDAIHSGFPVGKDDAFDAVVGVFGMLQICLGQRPTGDTEEPSIRQVEGWILGRSY